MKIIFVFLFLFTMPTLAKEKDFYNKREIALLSYSTFQKPYLGSDGRLRSQRASDLGLMVGFEDVFELWEIPWGVWGYTMTSTVSVHGGVSVKPLDWLQFKIGIGAGENGYNFSNSSIGETVDVKKLYGAQASFQCNYQFPEFFTLGVGADSNLNFGVILGIRF